MLKRIREMFKNEKGLTLVELLAVIVILAIVGAIAFVMIGNIIENSKKDAHVANALQMVESVKLYEANGKEIGSGGVTAKQLQDADVLDQIYDPWNKDKLEGANLTSSKVVKNDDEYVVTLKSTKDNNDITSQKESDLRGEGSRDLVGASTTPNP